MTEKEEKLNIREVIAKGGGGRREVEKGKVMNIRGDRKGWGGCGK